MNNNVLTERKNQNLFNTENEVGVGVFLFVVASLLSGRVLRYPFDDEVFSLFFVTSHSLSEIVYLISLTGFDLHGPLSYSAFKIINILGFSETSMRLFSLFCEAISVGIWHTIARHFSNKEHPKFAYIRIAIIGLTPLAIGVGDSIRYYPIFSFFVSIFCYCYIFSIYNSNRLPLIGGISLGLAATTSVLAIYPLIALIIHRYLINKNKLSFRDIYFFLVVFIFSIPGISFFILFLRRINYEPNQISSWSILKGGYSLTYNTFGLFGGYFLGISYSWIVIPIIIICTVLCWDALTYKGNTHHCKFAIQFIAVLIILFPLFSFLIPKIAGRSYLFIAPAITCLTALGFFRNLEKRKGLFYVSLYSIFLIAFFCNSRLTLSPLKRNLAVPYNHVEAFLNANVDSQTLIITTDPTTEYLSRINSSSTCVSFWSIAKCAIEKTNKTNTVIVIDGLSDKEPGMDWKEYIKSLETDFHYLTTTYFGYDLDARLKSFLSRKKLSPFILRARVFQRK